MDIDSQVEEFDSSSSESSCSSEDEDETRGEDDLSDQSHEEGQPPDEDSDHGLPAGVSEGAKRWHSIKGNRKRKKYRKRNTAGLRKKLRTHYESVDDFNPEARNAQSAELERIRRLELQRSISSPISLPPPPVTSSHQHNIPATPTPPHTYTQDVPCEGEGGDSPELVRVDLTAKTKPSAETIVIDSGSDSDSTNDRGHPPTGVETHLPPKVEGQSSKVQPSTSLHRKYDDPSVPRLDGKLVVNINHAPSEPDVFLAPQLAKMVKPHQIGGIRFLFDNIIESLSRFSSSPGFGCILAHSMGLGKTLQVISFIDIFMRYTLANHTLCVVPVNTLQNWINEFDRWLPVQPQSSNQNSPSSHMTGLPSNDTQYRTFGVFLLSESCRSMEARVKVISEWQEMGGVLLIGYEMFRLLSLSVPSLAGNKMAVKRRKNTSLKTDSGTIDLDENEKEMDALIGIQRALCDPGPDLVVCDEGHRIKNDYTNISQALKRMRTRRRIVMTGYPLQNNLIEYWCMVDFVRPKYLGTKQEFADLFERPITNGQCADSTPNDVRLMRYRSHVLHSLLEGFVLRRGHEILKSSLPPKFEHVLFLRPSDVQATLYNYNMSLIQQGGGVSAGTGPLKAFAVCTKIWNHPDIYYNEVIAQGAKKPTLTTLLDDAGLSKPSLTGSKVNTGGESSCKIEWPHTQLPAYQPDRIENSPKMMALMDLIEKSVHFGDKILIFSQSLSTLSFVEKLLSQRRIPIPHAGMESGNVQYQNETWTKNQHFYRIDGSTGSMERDKLIKLFNSPTNTDCWVFLLSTKAGCLGINLIGANRVVVMDVSWNPCYDAQAVCRVYRYGQTKPCYIYRLVCDGTMERKIFERQISKQGMSDRVVDHLQPERHLSTQDIISLITPLSSLPPGRDLSSFAQEFMFDPVLMELCCSLGNQLTKLPFRHESLLIDSANERMTEVEKYIALRGFQAEWKALKSGPASVQEFRNLQQQQARAGVGVSSKMVQRNLATPASAPPISLKTSPSTKPVGKMSSAPVIKQSVEVICLDSDEEDGNTVTTPPKPHPPLPSIHGNSPVPEIPDVSSILSTKAQTLFTSSQTQASLPTQQSVLLKAHPTPTSSAPQNDQSSVLSLLLKTPTSLEPAVTTSQLSMLTEDITDSLKTQLMTTSLSLCQQDENKMTSLKKRSPELSDLQRSQDGSPNKQEISSESRSSDQLPGATSNSLESLSNTPLGEAQTDSSQPDTSTDQQSGDSNIRYNSNSNNATEDNTNIFPQGKFLVVASSRSVDSTTAGTVVTISNTASWKTQSEKSRKSSKKDPLSTIPTWAPPHLPPPPTSTTFKPSTIPLLSPIAAHLLYLSTGTKLPSSPPEDVSKYPPIVSPTPSSPGSSQASLEDMELDQSESSECVLRDAVNLQQEGQASLSGDCSPSGDGSEMSLPQTHKEQSDCRSALKLDLSSHGSKVNAYSEDKSMKKSKTSKETKTPSKVQKSKFEFSSKAVNDYSQQSSTSDTVVFPMVCSPLPLCPTEDRQLSVDRSDSLSAKTQSCTDYKPSQSEVGQSCLSTIGQSSLPDVQSHFNTSIVKTTPPLHLATPTQVTMCTSGSSLPVHSSTHSITPESLSFGGGLSNELNKAPAQRQPFCSSHISEGVYHPGSVAMSTSLQSMPNSVYASINKWNIAQQLGMPSSAVPPTNNQLKATQSISSDNNQSDSMSVSWSTADKGSQSPSINAHPNTRQGIGSNYLLKEPPPSSTACRTNTQPDNNLAAYLTAPLAKSTLTSGVVQQQQTVSSAHNDIHRAAKAGAHNDIHDCSAGDQHVNNSTSHVSSSHINKASTNSTSSGHSGISPLTDASVTSGQKPKWIRSFSESEVPGNKRKSTNRLPPPSYSQGPSLYEAQSIVRVDNWAKNVTTPTIGTQDEAVSFVRDLSEGESLRKRRKSEQSACQKQDSFRRTSSMSEGRSNSHDLFKGSHGNVNEGQQNLTGSHIQSSTDSRSSSQVFLNNDQRHMRLPDVNSIFLDPPIKERRPAIQHSHDSSITPPLCAAGQPGGKTIMKASFRKVMPQAARPNRPIQPKPQLPWKQPVNSRESVKQNIELYSVHDAVTRSSVYPDLFPNTNTNSLSQSQSRASREVSSNGHGSSVASLPTVGCPQLTGVNNSTSVRECTLNPGGQSLGRNVNLTSVTHVHSSKVNFGTSLGHSVTSNKPLRRLSQQDSNSVAFRSGGPTERGGFGRRNSFESSHGSDTCVLSSISNFPHVTRGKKTAVVSPYCVANSTNRFTELAKVSNMSESSNTSIGSVVGCDGVTKVLSSPLYSLSEDVKMSSHLSAQRLSQSHMSDSQHASNNVPAEPGNKQTGRISDTQLKSIPYLSQQVSQPALGKTQNSHNGFPVNVPTQSTSQRLVTSNQLSYNAHCSVPSELKGAFTDQNQKDRFKSSHFVSARSMSQQSQPPPYTGSSHRRPSWSNDRPGALSFECHVYGAQSGKTDYHGDASHCVSSKVTGSSLKSPVVCRSPNVTQSSPRRSSNGCDQKFVFNHQSVSPTVHYQASSSPNQIGGSPSSLGKFPSPNHRGTSSPNQVGSFPSPHLGNFPSPNQLSPNQPRGTSPRIGTPPSSNWPSPSRVGGSPSLQGVSPTPSPFRVNEPQPPHISAVPQFVQTPPVNLGYSCPIDCTSGESCNGYRPQAQHTTPTSMASVNTLPPQITPLPNVIVQGESPPQTTLPNIYGKNTTHKQAVQFVSSGVQRSTTQGSNYASHIPSLYGHNSRPNRPLTSSEPAYSSSTHSRAPLPSFDQVNRVQRSNESFGHRLQQDMSKYSGCHSNCRVGVATRMCK